ncbi:MAG: ubiG 2 [Mycobacterium sp.]|nr:ubiG 2 [Mycobacterium sp.]
MTQPTMDPAVRFLRNSVGVGHQALPPGFQGTLASVTVMGPPLPLDGLRAHIRDQPALPALSPQRYAQTHALYEAASDQRSRLQSWLATALPPMLTGRDPVRIVGVGVGDGSVDTPLAAALAAGGRRVHYTGVEPHPPSAAQFASRLNAIDAQRLTPTVVIGDFADHDAGHPADLVHFVHSLYYVTDLSAALDHGLSMVAPGGLLLAAIAPLQPLCVLTEMLCPWAGLTPWFAEDVYAELELRGLSPRSESIVGHLDARDALDDPLGGGEGVLDFLIGARSRELGEDARADLLDYLRGISLPGRPGVLPHPVDILLTRVP